MAFTNNNINRSSGLTLEDVQALIHSSNADMHVVTSDNAASLVLPSDKTKIIVMVDTSTGDYDISQVPVSQLLDGTELVFKKVTPDNNKIINGETNHVDKQYETYCMSYINGALINY